jgi:hypothetical protein
MPPNDPTPSPSAGTGPSAPPAGAGAGDGSVNVTMPKAAFDALHQQIMQIAQILDSLAQDVGKQAGGAKMPDMGGMPAGGPPEGGPSSEDEEFLKGIAAQGSAR